MAVVAGYHDNTTRVTRRIEKRGDLAQAFGRPGEVQLVAAGELRIHCVMDGADDALLRIGDS
jgi:hypothetical protein